MAFGDLVDGVNQACLQAFGQAYTFTPAETGIAQTITGILSEGAQLEESAPGDGSSSAVLFVKSGSITPEPAGGDEIASATTIYKVLLPKRDSGGGLILLLRKHEDIVG
jgi:hypothetical protein